MVLENPYLGFYELLQSTKRSEKWRYDYFSVRCILVGASNFPTLWTVTTVQRHKCISGIFLHFPRTLHHKLIDLAIGGFCYGPRGQETTISQASKKFLGQNPNLKHHGVIETVNFLSKNNFKYLIIMHFQVYAKLRGLEMYSDPSIWWPFPQRDPYLKTWKSAPVGRHLIQVVDIEPWLATFQPSKHPRHFLSELHTGSCFKFKVMIEVANTTARVPAFLLRECSVL